MRSFINNKTIIDEIKRKCVKTFLVKEANELILYTRKVYIRDSIKKNHYFHWELFQCITWKDNTYT